MTAASTGASRRLAFVVAVSFLGHLPAFLLSSLPSEVRLHCFENAPCVLSTTTQISGYQTQVQVLEQPNHDVLVVIAAYAPRLQHYFYYEMQLSDDDLYSTVDFGDEVHDREFMLHALLGVLTVHPTHGMLRQPYVQPHLRLKHERRRHEGSVLWKAAIAARAGAGALVVTARTLHEAYDPHADGYLSLQVYERSSCRTAAFQITKQQFAALGLSSDGGTLRQQLLSRIAVVAEDGASHQQLLVINESTRVVFLCDPEAQHSH